MFFMGKEHTHSKDFERFHRRFLSYGLGSNLAYFFTKTLCNVFSLSLIHI